MAAGILSYPVRAPTWELNYKRRNITQRIAGMVVSINYTDQVAHYSDTLEIVLEDRERRWQGPWFPNRGDQISFQLGYANEGLLPCGDFQVDEIELKGPPDEVTLKCIATFPKNTVRSPQSRSFEGAPPTGLITLLDIAKQLADNNGFTLIAAPGLANASWARVTQQQETDLQFLHRISEEHNYDFSIRGTQMIFYERGRLESQAPVAEIQRGRDAVRTFEFKAKTWHTFQSATIAYQDVANKKLIGATATDQNTPAVDNLYQVKRIETQPQADVKAAAALHAVNMLGVTCQLEIEGAINIVAGVNISLTNFGPIFSGVWHIHKSSHKIDRSTGYVTEFEARHL